MLAIPSKLTKHLFRGIPSTFAKKTKNKTCLGFGLRQLTDLGTGPILKLCL